MANAGAGSARGVEKPCRRAAGVSGLIRRLAGAGVAHQPAHAGRSPHLLLAAPPTGPYSNARQSRAPTRSSPGRRRLLVIDLPQLLGISPDLANWISAGLSVILLLTFVAGS